MIHLYDTAIADFLTQKLTESGNPDFADVRVYKPDNIHELVAAIKGDEVPLPCVSIFRTRENIDNSRYNFSRAIFGFPVNVNPKNKNEVIYEYSLPIDLGYSLQVMSNKVWLADEIIRSLLSNLRKRYFLEIFVRYGINRKISFGISAGSEITTQTGSSEYHAVGTLYQKSLPLDINGAVMLFSGKKKIMHLELDKIISNLEDNSTLSSSRLLIERNIRNEN